jgi:uncharacterized protein (DUF2249 family)
MKKLSSEEFALLPIKGKGRSSAVFNTLINLKEGEGLLIEQKDWNRKAAPSSLIRYIEKKYQMKFSFGALTNGSGWAVQRVNEIKKENKKTENPRVAQPKQNNERMELKSELTLFYLGRISINKIERIEDTIKAAFLYFWKADKKEIEELFYEVIDSLQSQGHIVIESEKTYIPLKQN